jgi:hypothetical protein
MENRVSFSLSAEKKAIIDDALNKLYSELMPNLVTLTAEQRQEMLKMGDKTLAFVQNSIKHADTTPSLVPSYLDMDEMKKDLAATEELRPIMLKMENLFNAVVDTYMVAGSEAYGGGLLFYNSVKGGLKANIPGAEEAYEDLRKRFPGRPSKKADEAESE